MWILVGKWEKDPDKRDQVMSEVAETVEHWEELALDVGLDPSKNVNLAEDEKEIRVGISQEMRSFYRGVPQPK